MDHCMIRYTGMGGRDVDIYLDTPRTIPNSLRSRPQPFVDCTSECLGYISTCKFEDRTALE